MGGGGCYVICLYGGFGIDDNGVLGGSVGLAGGPAGGVDAQIGTADTNYSKEGSWGPFVSAQLLGGDVGYNWSKDGNYWSRSYGLNSVGINGGVRASVGMIDLW